MNMGWRDAIERVLSEAAGPLHYGEISDRILSQGYYQTVGATPYATVNAYISTSIKREGVRSPFLRVAKGVYALRARQQSITEETTEVAVLRESEIEAPAASAASDPNADDSIIRCLGMYWQRELVVWKQTPKILGRQQALSRPVDFGRQSGIYVLYDHHTVVYVGRSVDRPLGRRLFEHTIDRLASRWNRFSWFGLLDVNDEGQLIDVPLRVSTPTLIATLEALLIETLEPPQNRKRGDDFSVVEYIQDLDPELKEREIQATLRAIEERLRGSASVRKALTPARVAIPVTFSADQFGPETADVHRLHPLLPRSSRRHVDMTESEKPQ